MYHSTVRKRRHLSGRAVEGKPREESPPQSLISATPHSSVAQGLLNNHPWLFCAGTGSSSPLGQWAGKPGKVLFALGIREWHGGHRSELLPGHQHRRHHVPQHCHTHPGQQQERQQRPQQSLSIQAPGTGLVWQEQQSNSSGGTQAQGPAVGRECTHTSL